MFVIRSRVTGLYWSCYGWTGLANAQRFQPCVANGQPLASDGVWVAAPD